ncbi:alpha/beta hydrolase [Demequina sp.]|uniref:alpha/beta hydrolase n=1 Tax=Demequina sp. TaxID=2050685 RepID=UPI003D136072
MTVTETTETRRRKLLAASDQRGRTERRPPHAFELTYNRWGLVGALLFFSASLVPSLLPRSGVVQGIITGLTAVIGYGLACSFVGIWHYVQGPVPHGKVRRWTLLSLTATLAIVLGYAIWKYVGWQNQTRELMGMEAMSPLVWPTILLVGAVTFWLLLAAGRAFRTLFRWSGEKINRWLPRRFALTLNAIVMGLLIWGLLSGAILDAFFWGANAIFSTRDSGDKPFATQPTDQYHSGGPGSVVAWDDLGRQGRDFISRTPKVEDINAVSGGGAMEPIRVYVGLKSGETVQERADLLLEELKRTGAFDRKAIIIGSTTGTGWLDPNAVDPIDYMFNGDNAIAGMQYSYLPSWISLFADSAITKETAVTMFTTIHDYWVTLPEDSRPKLYLFGLSLGSFGVEGVLTDVDIVNAPFDGALMAGPPFLNPLHTQITDDRDEGTPAWNPWYNEGRTVRFTAQDDLLKRDEGVWGPNTRLVYLQHGTDGVVWFSPTLLYREPDWLKEGERAPDVSDEMTWVPIVSFWQGAMDLAGAGGAPQGFGHEYAVHDYTDAWAGVFNIEGWTDADSEAVAAAVQAEHDEFDARIAAQDN